ncbi:NADH-quinone oxidoreductase subunit L [Blochmannia endosymbiont of Camponotus (Colobopsis) obliquus]|uniref:NADH-quinone oxidoreductase subunit L n=1 Tax=Blochmannia endosymbiont of Camponotus (Colobopsis) obliquus TaxID=1505597 RepID=UPI00061A7DFA|nr:NADH-quinone oxidoreductase subunit L [Blochmannia endosymbiont of Camponotus (Colobopsis) obliquus]AKC60635.1 NADH-quinone oxidoreductase subunit L [Blochmannia endosymbiont of Camponotus (Colobopsis) obliquus]
MNLIYLTVLFPLLGFLSLSFCNNLWKEKISSIIGIGSIGFSGLVTVYIVIDYFNHVTSMNKYVQSLWVWISVDHLHIPVSFMIDGLSLVMLSVVIGVSFLVHIYASWYMQGDAGYSRFFAYMNLFVANMIILVLADNLLLMYLGWEGVGLCSYLLIGFYYTNVLHGLAALKAFIITRISDILLIYGLFILYNQFGTLNFSDLSLLVFQKKEEASLCITWAVLLLLSGSIGKSAQFPLQIWLTDAMVAPSPVSALIHAATMVTSGVYLISRTHALFLVSVNILEFVAVIGSITLIISSVSALVQNDLKRILAYSTISQVGYMFLSLGVQGWYAAMFHLVTHAVFKALLFLASGSLIVACRNERNIFKMGGLYKSMPLIYICFIIGGLSLSAFPIITSGFYSKEAILHSIIFVYSNHGIFMIIGLLGSFLTSIYTFRMIFLIFHGKKKIEVCTNYDFRHNFPLIILLIFSTFIGSWIKLPLSGVLPINHSDVNSYLFLNLASSIIIILGICLAGILWFLPNNVLYIKYREMISKFFLTLFYCFDLLNWLYKQLFVKSYLFITRLLSQDPLNIIINSVIILIRFLSCLLVLNENGQVRWYALMTSWGALIVIAMLFFL